MKVSKHINLGEIGETPKKSIMFNRDDPASTLSLATPQRSTNNNIKSVLRTSNNVSRTSFLNSNIDDRPKTSRGKAMPSPDEFADYVIPSPPKTKKEVDDIFEQYNVNSINSKFPDFKQAIWSGSDNDNNKNIQYNQQYFDSDEDDEDERILADRQRYTTNSSSSNIFSTSVRHSNQEDFLKNNKWFEKEFVDSSDSGDDFVEYDPYDDKYCKLNNVDEYDDDDDDNYDDDYDDDDTDDDDNDYDSDDYHDIIDRAFDEDEDEDNPILTDDRIIALGCWLFGVALKA